MTKKLLKIVLLAGIAQAAFTAPAMAEEFSSWDDKDRFMIRARVIGVLPDAGGSTSIGGTPDADNAIVPELDFTYFFTKNVAAELILATSPHDLSAKGTAAGDLDLGDAWLLPPTLTLQYHFTPDRQFSPYIGAGVNYTVTYSEDKGANTTSLKADNSFGPALQAGADYWLSDHWGLNFDVKKIWMNVDADISNGAVTGDVDLDPWIVGAGVSYRF